MSHFSTGTACLKAAYDFRSKVSHDMYRLSDRAPWTGRILTLVVSPGTLLISLALRIAGVVEPILAGIAYDLIQFLASNERKLEHLLNIFNRPGQVVDNVLSGLILNGLVDIIFVGSGLFTGLISPQFAYKNFNHKEYNNRFNRY